MFRNLSLENDTSISYHPAFLQMFNSVCGPHLLFFLSKNEDVQIYITSSYMHSKVLVICHGMLNENIKSKCTIQYDVIMITLKQIRCCKRRIYEIAKKMYSRNRLRIMKKKIKKHLFKQFFFHIVKLFFKQSCC